MSDRSTIFLFAAIGVGLFLAFQNTFDRAIGSRNEDVLLEGNRRSIIAQQELNVGDPSKQCYVDKRTGRGYRMSDVAFA